MGGKRYTGTVVTLHSDGYGFVRVDNVDTFFHAKDVRPIGTNLRRGDAVNFTIGKGRHGKPAAFDVKLLQPARPVDAAVGEFAGLPAAID